MRKSLFQIAQVVVVVLGIVFAFLWIKYPDGHHYDAYTAVFAALLPAFELLKRKFSNADRDEAELKQLLRESLRQRVRAASAPPSTAPVASGSATRPVLAPDPQQQLFLEVIEHRNQLESCLKEYARAKDIDPSGTAAQVLARLPFSQSDKDAIKGFFDVANDLVHQSGALVQWAADNAEVYENLVKLRLKAVKKF